MNSAQIQDYLQTQALKLNRDSVAVSYAAAQAVLANARAHIEDSLLLHDALPERLVNQIDKLKQIFMVLDSAYSRQTVQTAAVYARQPEQGDLVRVAQMGAPIEPYLAANHQDTAWQYLPVRTAASGWANIAENVEGWLQNGELSGEHHHRAASQISLPICAEDGAVYGVLQVEAAQMPAEEALAEWVGVVLAVLPVVRDLWADEFQAA